jgi:hypothetical protein
MERDNKILRGRNAMLEQVVSSLKRTRMPVPGPFTNAFELSNGDVDDRQFKQELKTAFNSGSSSFPSNRGYRKLRSINKVPVPERYVI